MRDAVARTCGCGAPSTFKLTRTHDGGGQAFTCDAHLANAARAALAGLPSWATNPTQALTVWPVTP